ncbi:hypothetical protein SlsnVgp065 [Spodoptera littoralis nucleopolyhedrovirus]|uniref:Uncharacterized protein n=1 Tax=Spodoptera littoralis nuclear polyhedrosis virus TaxID=10456 RepID=M1JTG1_NPVSL|nr:hypothetical protein SlsnVgp065 [Spodoptera littoralis nucleopolyhedrovirus]AGE89920.1 hypothetical protein SlsnVgp065 [Spodoptera littoralis nucleopolyhedrovirus]AYU75254.1 hypothetical protein [Spodoptera littoralis nucleopolyhedrovirus]
MDSVTTDLLFDPAPWKKFPLLSDMPDTSVINIVNKLIGHIERNDYKNFINHELMKWIKEEESLPPESLLPINDLMRFCCKFKFDSGLKQTTALTAGKFKSIPYDYLVCKDVMNSLENAIFWSFKNVTIGNAYEMLEFYDDVAESSCKTVGDKYASVYNAKMNKIFENQYDILMGINYQNAESIHHIIHFNALVEFCKVRSRVYNMMCSDAPDYINNNIMFNKFKSAIINYRCALGDLDARLKKDCGLVRYSGTVYCKCLNRHVKVMLMMYFSMIIKTMIRHVIGSVEEFDKIHSLMYSCLMNDIKIIDIDLREKLEYIKVISTNFKYEPKASHKFFDNLSRTCLCIMRSKTFYHVSESLYYVNNNFINMLYGNDLDDFLM